MKKQKKHKIHKQSIKVKGVIQNKYIIHICSYGIHVITMCVLKVSKNEMFTCNTQTALITKTLGNYCFKSDNLTENETNV